MLPEDSSDQTTPIVETPPTDELIGKTAILHTYPKPYNGWRAKIIRRTSSKSFPDYAVEVIVSENRTLVTYANRDQLEIVD